MPINKDTLNKRLEKALGRYDAKAVDVDGDVVPLADNADAFKFNFTKDGEDYGTAYATIDDTNRLTLWFDDELMDSPSAPTPGVDYDDTWTGFMEYIKQWALKNQLRFDKDNKDNLSSEMARRKSMKEKEKLAEGYHAMGKKASYNDAVPNVKIVLQHSKVMQEGEQRFRHIEKIFVENQNGERFLVPTTKPGLARVFARHIAEGGTPYDERAGHIQSLVEEYNKMAGFVRATRSGQFNESAQQLVQEGVNHYVKLRESLSKMTGHRGYTAYFESWTPSLMEDESDAGTINELFVQETLDPRIESVMPILSRLHKQVAEMKEVSELDEWAESLLSEKMVMGADTDASSGGVSASYVEEDEGIQSNNPQGIPEGEVEEGKTGPGLWANIHAKRERIKHGSGEKMRKPGSKGAPTAKNFRDAAKEDVAEGGDSINSIIDKGIQNTLKSSHDSKYELVKSKMAAAREILNSSNNSAKINAAESVIAQCNLLLAKYRATEKIDLEIKSAQRGLVQLDQALQSGSISEPEYRKYYDANIKRTSKFEARKQAFLDQISELESELGLSQGVAEDLDANQKRVGQLGPTEKITKKNPLRGKLVGANESVQSTMKLLDMLSENFINSTAQAVTTESQEDNPVVNAITRRILMQRPDILELYGPERVTAAIDDVAEFVGDVEEIGSSDVSGWVRQVEQQLQTSDRSREAFKGMFGGDANELTKGLSIREDDMEEATDDSFNRMMNKMTSKSALDTREATAMMFDLIHDQGASYEEALHQASVSYEIDPAELKAAYQQSQGTDKEGVAEGSESDRIQALYDKLERMEERLGHDDPRVKAIRDEIRGMKDEYHVIGKQGMSEAKSDDPDYDKSLKRFKKGLPPKQVAEGQEDLDAILRIIKK